MHLVTTPLTPVFSTIQGEGSLVGTLSTFVRTWGCNDSCDWCDTKDSWRPGSKSVEMTVADILDQVQKHRNQHVVITGGNPLLQGHELLELVMSLRTCGYHVTLETQGSVYHRVASHVHLLSLSPKLHAWNETVLRYLLEQGGHYPQDVQFKVVVQTRDDVLAALSRLNTLRSQARRGGFENVFCYLQPEYGVGSKWPAGILEIVQEEQTKVGEYGWVRILGQVHKSHLRVV